MYTVLVADDNTTWLQALTKGLNAEEEFEVVASAGNGKTALELIEKLCPDIIILDIIMPECDGVHIVNYIRTNMKQYNPIIYMLSGIGSDTVITILNELDIDFYNMKPISLQLTIQNLKKILLHKGKKTTDSKNYEALTREQLMHNILTDLGLSPHLLCTKYIFDALNYYNQNPESFTMLTKILYPHIADKNNSTAGAVEKNIRFGIKRMESWNTVIYREIFSFYINKKITNSVFLNIISAYIEAVFNKNMNPPKG